MGFILSSTATGTLSPTADSEKLLLLVKSLWQDLHRHHFGPGKGIWRNIYSEHWEQEGCDNIRHRHSSCKLLITLVKRMRFSHLQTMYAKKVNMRPNEIVSKIYDPEYGVVFTNRDHP